MGFAHFRGVQQLLDLVVSVLVLEKHAVAVDHAVLVQTDFPERRLDFVKFCKVFAHFAYPVDFLVFIYSEAA